MMLQPCCFRQRLQAPPCQGRELERIPLASVELQAYLLQEQARRYFIVMFLYLIPQASSCSLMEVGPRGVIRKLVQKP
jgi:hypothetical protein